jgi:hypothetical protein
VVALVDALAGRPAIHLTLGTVYPDAAVLRAALAGLRRLDLPIVATVGPRLDPGVLGPQPPGVLVRRYVPHAQLLPHCALVVSQGGAGILLGALASFTAAARAVGREIAAMPGPDTVLASLVRSARPLPWRPSRSHHGADPATGSREAG